ncbi:MAG: leucine-rich repeat-containing protein kinase family protein [Bacteroidota bacterium]
MQTLEQLRSGELAGSTSLKLSCGLTEFPEELFGLANTLELLDLSNNHLKSLPFDFSRFSKLKIAFFSDNLFTEYPEVLASCPLLEMVGFKSNQLVHVSEKALSKNIRWLILTNNKIQQLPKSIGHCYRLQKVALAGNCLRELPDEMAECRNLELLRISANNIQKLPEWLMRLPKLSWLAYSDNPCSVAQQSNVLLPEISWNDLELKEQLGEGASGIISKAVWNNFFQKEVAVKVFKGEVTSDGLPLSEMNTCSLAGNHPALVTLLGKISHHPHQKEGLVFDLIPPSFRNLGKPPSFITCTRDTFEKHTCFSLKDLTQIALQTASVLEQLHSKGIMHGDFYAHNLMSDDQSNVLLGDFGAATMYDRSSPESGSHEKMDIRAYGCLLDDLLEHLSAEEKEHPITEHFKILRKECFLENVQERPVFSEIQKQITSLIDKVLI